MKIIPNYLTTNHAKGRDGRKPDVIVIHVMQGTMSGTLSWFRNPRAKVSAHYGVSLLGNVVQYVKDEDTAWANGLVVRPTAAIVLGRPDANPNSYTLSIEFEGTGKEPLTALQKEAGVELIRTLAAEHGIPLNRRHIIGHREIRADKACPGAIDVDELVALAADTEAVISGTLNAEGLTVTTVPPNLDKIIALTPPVLREVARVRRLDPDKIMDYTEAIEAALRIMGRNRVKYAKEAADILAFGIKLAGRE